MYLFLKLSLPAAFGTAAVIVLYVLDIFPMTDIAKLSVSLIAVIISAYAPDVFVSNTTQKRRKKIEKALPDGLDLMVICAEAGLSVDATLLRVSRELGASWPELSDELSLTSIEIGFLPDRSQALANLSRRVKLDGVRGIVNTLVQTERYGTPLAQALRVLSAELRNNRLMKAEEKAARLPAILTVPMILFIMRALFVVLIGPGGSTRCGPKASCRTVNIPTGEERGPSPALVYTPPPRSEPPRHGRRGDGLAAGKGQLINIIAIYVIYLALSQRRRVRLHPAVYSPKRLKAALRAPFGRAFEFLAVCFQFISSSGPNVAPISLSTPRRITVL